MHLSTLNRAAAITAVAVLLGATNLVTGAGAHPGGGILTTTYRVRAADGQTYSITNHITREIRSELARPGRRHEYLLAWSGDESTNQPFPSTQDEPDFLAVIDVTKGTRTYGKVVNTVTVDSVFGNEPHNLQNLWHKGDKVYAAGLLSDITYVFDVKHLPEVRLSGVTPPSATRCGTFPASYEVRDDGTAYAMYLGGPNVDGTCRYTNGEIRDGNGPGGSPGEIVHIGRNGKVLAEVPSGLADGEGGTFIPESPLFPGEGPTHSCVTIPALPATTCANPYGVAMREDLDRMVVGDVGEPRNTAGGAPPAAFSVRDTVRIFDISDPAHPELVSLTHLPPGIRPEIDPRLSEPFGGWRPAVTHRPWHRGAFLTTTNGALYYTPDITDPEPVWRNVYDDFHAFLQVVPTQTPGSRTDAGGWTRVSPDDRYLYKLVMGGGPFSPGDTDTGMLFVLDIQPLLVAGRHPTCSIDSMDEVSSGGAEPDCPKLVSVVPIYDPTNGGPQSGAMDTFRIGHGGLYHETSRPSRIATSNYFLALTLHDGDHRICMWDVGPRGQVSLDTSFKDEHLGTPCLDFDRPSWPHGDYGNARPNGLLFAVADRDLR